MRSCGRHLWPGGGLALVFVLSFSAVAVGDEGGSEPTPGLERTSDLVGESFRISGPASVFHDVNPAVAYNPTSNQFLVVWVYGAPDQTQVIRGQLLAGDGTRIGPNFRISYSPGSPASPSVAYNSINEQYLVAWVDHRNDLSMSEVFGRRVKANGNPVGASFRISDTASRWDSYQSALDPVVTYNSTANQYLIAWEEYQHYPDPLPSEVYAQRVKANGDLVGENIRISGGAATGNESRPAVTYNTTSNQYLVVWQDTRHVPPEYINARSISVYGQRVKANGDRAGWNFPIRAGTFRNHGSPSVSYNSSDNQFLVVWNRWIFSYEADILGQILKANGNRRGQSFLITEELPQLDSWSPTVAHNPTSDQYLVVWTHEPRRSEDQVFGRRYDTGGNPVAGRFPIDVGVRPTMVFNPIENAYLLVWSDWRSAYQESDIYGLLIAG